MYKIKLWYLCDKETGKPIKLDVLTEDAVLSVPGTCTKKDLIKAVNGIDRDVEDTRMIEIIIFEAK